MSIWALRKFLSSRRKRELLLVLMLMVVGGFAELVTIGAVVPFLSVLAGDAGMYLPVLDPLLDQLSRTTGERLINATIIFVLAAVLAGFIRFLLTWATQAFVTRLGHDLSVAIQERILLQPYTYHLQQKSGEIIASLDKVQVLTLNVVLQLMQATAGGLIALFILIALLQIDFGATLAAATLFAGIYITVGLVVRRRLDRNSAIVGSAYHERVQLVQESLGGIRDVIIDDSHQLYVDAFRSTDSRFARARIDTAFLAAAPRFIIETAAMVLIATLALFLAGRAGGIAAALPVLGALALGGQRLLPLLQQLYYGWSAFAGNRAVVKQVLAFLALPLPSRPPHVEPLPFQRMLELDRVSFIYPGCENAALEDVSLSIERGSRIGIVGRSGSGKSTLADILMGLLEPNSGRLILDGRPIEGETRRRWQGNIAHVPQSIFLADASIAMNIALSLDATHVDMGLVREAARIAQIDTFIDSVPEGFQTVVGERGVRLSGGQRQRIGLARAIYKQAPVLVLDEATSALDYETEEAVMTSLAELQQSGRTIIIIAHRLSTLVGCDAIVRMSAGRIAALECQADGAPEFPS